MSGISRSVAIGLLSALGAFSMMQPSIQKFAPTIQTSPRPVLKRRSNGFVSYWNYNHGPGWTAAHVQRMAKKRRNKARHKAACKGK